MELQYLWIEDYRSINHQGFNLGGEYNFMFNYETGKLTCKKNESFISGFFGNKISNVTAIIGRNGSGKSTFLDFIKLNIATDIGNTNLGYLCIFRVRGRNKLFLYNSLHNVEVKIPTELNGLIENAPRGTIDGNLVSLEFPTAFLCYSPTLDYTIEEFQFTPVDLSTNYFFRNAKPIKNSRYSYFENLAFMEKRRQLEFMSDYHGYLPFKRPQEIYMRPHVLDIDQILEEVKDDQQLFNNLTLWRSIFKETSETISDYAAKFSEAEIFETIFWHIINSTQIKERFFEERVDIPFLKQSPPYKPSSDTPAFEIVSELLKSNNGSIRFLPSFKDFNEFSYLLKNLNPNDAIYYFYARFNLESRSKHNSEVKFDAINKFLKAYYKISSIGDFLTFDFGLSSGESAWLSMFARLYEGREIISDYMEDINSSRTLSHNMEAFTQYPEIIVLIDEGETSFHPEWQRKFINTICDFLPQVLNVEKVQIIFASNSPFLISDLPKTNIQFIDLIDDKTVVIENEITSFGANIHDLLANDFFLNVPIGEFAENKITKAIKDLGNLNEMTIDKGEIINLIRLIDDPIVRNKMFQMYAVKYESANWEEGYFELQQKYYSDKLIELRNRKGNAKN